MERGEKMENQNNAQLLTLLETLNKRLYNIEVNVATIGEAVIKMYNRDNKIIKSAILSLQFFINNYLEITEDSSEEKE